MTRVIPPLLGYNNNVRYLGRTFHIQTEDSGTKYARIMTHLFIDGGRIVKTTRTDYGEVVDQPNMAETVRRMMKDQHKNMFLSLRSGEFDALIQRLISGQQAISPPDPALSRVPQMRTEALPSLSFTSGEEAKTTPGMSTLIIESQPAPDSISSSAVEQVKIHESASDAGKNEPQLAEPNSLEPVAAASRGRAEPLAPKRPSGRPRKAKSVAPPSAKMKAAGVTTRPSERPSRATVVRPPTSTHEAIDPRSQSIFGEATAGKQTLDEVILSFLEDEES